MRGCIVMALWLCLVAGMAACNLLPPAIDPGPSESTFIWDNMLCVEHTGTQTSSVECEPLP